MESGWCAARHAATRISPRPWPRRSARPSPADGARARPDVGRCFTWCRDPPRPAHHARRARGGRAAPPRWRAGAPGGGTQRTVLEPVVVHAEATQRAQVALLSACGLSVGYQHGGWNAIIAFWSRPPDLCSSGSGRPTPPCAPRRGTRSPDIDSVLVRGVFVRLRVRSCIVPNGIHEGWYPANTEPHLSGTRVPGGGWWDRVVVLSLGPARHRPGGGAAGPSGDGPCPPPPPACKFAHCASRRALPRLPSISSRAV